MTSGPLGKYSQAVASVLATFIIVSAVAVRIITQFTGIGIDTPFLDNLALIAMGAVFGAAASTSVNGNKIEAAHRRLDLVSAPPADWMQAHPESQPHDQPVVVQGSPVVVTET